MKYVYLIGLLIPSLLWAIPQKELNMNVTLYEIKDKRFEKVLDEVMSDVHLHLSEMQNRDKFSIIFIPPHIDTTTYFDVNPDNFEVASEEQMQIEKIDYTEILIYCTYERYNSGDSNGLLIYNETKFIVSDPANSEILQITDREKLIRFLPHVASLDDYYVWTYRYDPILGFQRLNSPFK